MFNLLRNCQTVFQSDCTFYFPTSSDFDFDFDFEFSTSSTIFLLWMIAVLVGVKWYLIMVLIYLSLMAIDVEHFFFPVVIGHLYVFGEIFFRFPYQILVGLFIFLLFNYKSSLYICTWI